MKKLTLLIFFTFIGCDYAAYHDSATGEGLNNEAGTCNEKTGLVGATNIVTYDQVKTVVFEKRCFSCHGSVSGSGGVNLSTYQGAKAWANQIDFTIRNNIMPKAPNPPLNQTEKDLVFAWVSSGALASVDNANICNNPSNQQPELDPNPQPVNEPLTKIPPDAEINYELVREKVFKLRCFACHSTAGGNADGKNFETYFNTLEEIDDIQEVIFEQEMPPLPRPPLNNIERSVILRWIQLGSPK